MVDKGVIDLTLEMVLEASRFSLWKTLMDGYTIAFPGTLLSSLSIAFVFFVFFDGIVNPKPKIIAASLLVGFLLNSAALYAISASGVPGSHSFAWADEYAIPYIKDLPRKKVIIEAADRSKDNTDGERGYHWNRYFDTKGLQNVSVIYAGKNKVAKTAEAPMKIIYDVKGKEKPYMTFQEIEINLGHGLDKGKYFYELHLPSGYYFNQ